MDVKWWFDKNELELTKLRLEILAFAGAVAAGLFATYQWLDGKDLERKRATMEIVSELKTDTPARAALSRYDDALRPLNEPLMKQLDVDAASKENGFSLLAKEIVIAHNLEPTIDSLVDYAEEAAQCGCKSVCDSELVNVFLGRIFRSIWGVAGPYILDQRSIDKLYGTGLQALAIRGNNLKRYCNRELGSH